MYFSFIGFVAGFLSSALGIGGGVILVPALSYLFHLEFKRAIGTSLLTIVPTSFVGVITHYCLEKSDVKFKGALIILTGSLIGAWIGSKFIKKLSARWLKILFSLLLIFVGLKLTGVFTLPLRESSQISINFYLIFLGLLAGISSSLLGIGGGIIIVPGLNLLFGFSIHQAVATSLLVIFPTTCFGALLHKRLQNIETKAVIYLIPAALLGAIAGGYFSSNLPSETLKLIFGIFLLLVSLKMILESLKVRLLNFLGDR